MKEKLMDILACPECKGKLRLKKAVKERGEIREGILVCLGCKEEYPIKNYIPRFIKNE